MSQYFDNIANLKNFIKILLGIIGAMLIINLLLVKSLISLSSNKDIVLQVPQFLEKGKYYIGATFASENVYKMWSRIWIESLANFSYKDIRKKYKEVYPFLDPQTAFKNKTELLKFIDFVEQNFITQKFKITRMDTKRLQGGYVQVKVIGKLTRIIGNKEDELSGIDYIYTITAYTKNGQIYINSIKSKFGAMGAGNNKRKLKQNKYINFKKTME